MSRNRFPFDDDSGDTFIPIKRGQNPRRQESDEVRRKPKREQPRPNKRDEDRSAW
jgi:hypothetical protein